MDVTVVPTPTLAVRIPALNPDGSLILITGAAVYPRPTSVNVRVVICPRPVTELKPTFAVALLVPYGLVRLTVGGIV